MNIRKAAVNILSSLIHQQRSLSHLSYALQEISDGSQRAYIQELCFGVARWYFSLTFLANQLLQKPLKEKDQDAYILLLIGLYELLHMRTAEHAAVSEAVKAAKAMKKPWAASLVNAILREFLRKKEELLNQVKLNDEALYAHPQWLIDSVKEAWPQHWQAILEANNQRPPMTLRVNQQKTSRDRYLQQLIDHGIKAKPTQNSPVGIILEWPCGVSALPKFYEGFVSVQDESAQCVCDLLELEEGLKVLDACAAPGGKASHILEACPTIESLTALDKDQGRLIRIQENFDRLHLSGKLICGDASQTKTWWDGELFDRILLDAACSATGVIRRHPDIKLFRREEDILALANRQLLLLQSLWPTLKPGGRLVYATCSILPAENDRVVEQFIKQMEDVQNILIEASWGHPMCYGRQIQTGKNQMDGFYMAVLEKRASERA